MIMKRLGIIIQGIAIAGLILFSSCENETEKAIAAITAMEKEMGANEEVDKKLADELLEAYTDFSDRFPEHEQTVTYLFHAGELARGLYAVGHFQKVCQNYPESDLAPKALLLMGLAFDNELRDAKRALSIYQEFLQKYPEHEWAAYAQDLIHLLNPKTTGESEPGSGNQDLEQVHEWLDKEKKTEGKEEKTTN